MMYRFPCLPALDMGIGWKGTVLNSVAAWHLIFVFGNGSVERIGHTIMLGPAKMIDQKIARNGGYPGHKRASLDIIRIQRFIHLDENFLGQVLGVVPGTGKAITDVINAPVVALDDFLPGGCIARNTATDQSSNELGIFQPALPRTPGTPGDGTAVRAPEPNTTTEIRYCVAKSSLNCKKKA